MEMNFEWILQHGWGFDGSAWREWTARLAEDNSRKHIVHVAERGYFGDAEVKPSFSQEKTFKVVVAHSLGLHLLNERVLPEADLIVLVSSFVAFHSDSDEESRRSRKLVSRMLKKLTTEPETVLADFYKNCYSPFSDHTSVLPGDGSKLNVDLLLSDLKLLDEHVFTVGSLPCDATLLVLHGDKDQIVDVEAIDEIRTVRPVNRCITISGAGHALPFTHAEACLMAISNELAQSRNPAERLEHFLAPYRSKTPHHFARLN
jgi:pimeloyl-[acyl-carrier protein] methyl ester esterase